MKFQIIFSILAIIAALHFAHPSKASEEGEEGGAAVGADKGITEEGELGLKFSPEAIQTIAPTFYDVTGDVITIPSKAVVLVKDTKSIFRVRDGWYKRIAIEVVKKQGDTTTVRSSELKSGDKVVIKRVGFFRVAEVIAVEGAAHSH